MKNDSSEFYSNCFLEVIKAKIRNPNVKILYVPVILNEVFCPHWMWSDEDGEHDFHRKGKLRWWQWFWHKGKIRTVSKGCYLRYINKMIVYKSYSGTEQDINDSKKHAAWSKPLFHDSTNYANCTNCNKDSRYIEWDGSRTSRFDYCPHCGSFMDLEEE